MARERGEDAYTGRAGQLAVAAELAMRGCNAAIPEVDVGTDLLAFREEPFTVVPIQVKTAKAKLYSKTAGHGARFNIPMRHLEAQNPHGLFYVLAVWLEGRFTDFIVISRDELRHLTGGGVNCGSVDKSGGLVFTLQFREVVQCGHVDMTRFRHAWSLLRPLHPPGS